MVGLLLCALALLGLCLPGRAQMVTGAAMPGYAETFGLSGSPAYTVAACRKQRPRQHPLAGRQADVHLPNLERRRRSR